MKNISLETHLNECDFSRRLENAINSIDGIGGKRVKHLLQYISKIGWKTFYKEFSRIRNVGPSTKIEISKFYNTYKHLGEIDTKKHEVKYFNVKVLNELNEAFYCILKNENESATTIISRSHQPKEYELIRVAYRQNMLHCIKLPGVIKTIQLGKYTPKEE